MAMSSLLTQNIIIVLATLLGGWLPLVRGWSDRALHLFVAAATGVFLGAAFLHLLPEFAGLGPGPGAWVAMAASIILLFGIERVGLAGGRGDGAHTVLGFATLIGLALHSVAVGYSLGAASEFPQTQGVIFVAILSHKTIEAFSLTTVLLLGRRSTRTVGALVALLALMVPLGVLVARLGGSAERAALTVPMALATGTFLYVSLCDLLPEVFHHRQDVVAKLVALMLGLAATALLTGA